jgi:hypothetical protein
MRNSRSGRGNGVLQLVSTGGNGLTGTTEPPILRLDSLRMPILREDSRSAELFLNLLTDSTPRTTLAKDYHD